MIGFKMTDKKTRGFTLIELMMVAIIGILVAVALPAYSNFQAKAKVAAGLAEIAAAIKILPLRLPVQKSL